MTILYLICYGLLSKVQDIATISLKQMSSLNATLSDKNMRGEHTLCTITIYKLSFILKMGDTRDY